MSAPEPETIYARTREEGKRRLRRPLVELAATALVGGFDVAVGVAALGLAAGASEARLGVPAAHLVGALAFGAGFVLVVVGRSELFTENFLVPIAALERGNRRSWLKLAELWLVTLLLNLAGGAALVTILTSRAVLPPEASPPLVRLADDLAGAPLLGAFLSALVAGALMTLMTWMVEGAAQSTGVRIALIALGSFDHAIVSTLELLFGGRYGADVGAADVGTNLAIAVAGNLIGGIGLVTVARFAQALGSSRGD
jgi:formate/nitrite transporter FocA (FNT family)